MPATPPIARLLISCPDRPGIVAAVVARSCSSAARTSSPPTSTRPTRRAARFFMRMEFTLDAGDERWAALEREFAATVAEPLAHGVAARVRRPAASGSRCSSRARTTACSTCCGAGAAASSTADGRRSWSPTTPTARADVEALRRALRPRPGRRADDKPAAEARDARAARAAALDLVVLARYMQILSRGLPRPRVGVPVINIHHSFLPAFAGRGPVSPRARARREDHRRDRALRDRGARRRADHRAGRRPRLPPRTTCAELTRIGARHRAHSCSRARCAGTCEDRVLVDGNKTVVFS